MNERGGCRRGREGGNVGMRGEVGWVGRVGVGGGRGDGRSGVRWE